VAGEGGKPADDKNGGTLTKSKVQEIRREYKSERTAGARKGLSKIYSLGVMNTARALKAPLTACDSGAATKRGGGGEGRNQGGEQVPEENLG